MLQLIKTVIHLKHTLLTVVQSRVPSGYEFWASSFSATAPEAAIPHEIHNIVRDVSMNKRNHKEHLRKTKVEDTDACL